MSWAEPAQQAPPFQIAPPPQPIPDPAPDPDAAVQDDAAQDDTAASGAAQADAVQDAAVQDAAAADAAAPAAVQDNAVQADAGAADPSAATSGDAVQVTHRDPEPAESHVLTTASPVANVAPSDWIEDPYAPHVTNGTTVRLGTAVGYLYNEPVNALAVGATMAVGQRFNRLTIESELAYLTIQSLDGTGTRLGTAERLGVLARFDVLRLGSSYVGGNSMFAVYVEGGGAVAWNQWDAPGRNAAPRDVPANTKRVEGQVGFGFVLDHRLQEPISFPRRVSWSLGWRIAGAPDGGDPTTVCRGETCHFAQTQPMSGDRLIERSMLFQSNLAMMW
ncbi:MAG TPA: hypothetical protein VH165_28005 [Kofleriaceae bacterium]|nr:hypothetical protein [Kofleriaceae bacterium]